MVELVGLQAASRGPQGPAGPDTTGVTTGSIRPTRIDSVVVLRGGRDPLGLEVDGVEDIGDFASRPPGTEVPETPSAGPGPSTESTPSAAPAPGRMWAGVVKDSRGEIGVLDADAVFGIVEALAKERQEPQALEVGDSG